MRKEKNPEEGALRWLANMFPFTDGSTDDTDKISNAIHVYAEAGANKIIELQDKIEELQEIIDVLKKESMKIS